MIHKMTGKLPVGMSFQIHRETGTVCHFFWHCSPTCPLLMGLGCAVGVFVHGEKTFVLQGHRQASPQ